MDAHAYVDECLSREDRIAFEARLRDDPELRRQVDLWQAQNDAICAAFRAPTCARGPLSLGRPFHENVSPPAIDFLRRAGAAATSSDTPAPPREPRWRTCGESRLDQPWRAGFWGRGRYGRL